MSDTSRDQTPRSLRALRGACYSLGIAFTLLWVVLAIMRLAYPFEVEWMEGAMMDHAVRVVNGNPIYTTPTIDFAAWLYPPLFYYIVAASMKLFGITWFAGRIVSVLSTLASAALIWSLTRRITRDRFVAAMSATLFFAAYHATGYYFDIVRNDAFFLLTLLLPIWVAVRWEGRYGAASVACLLIITFFTKQQAIFLLPAIGLWYAIRDRSQALTFLFVTFIGGAALLLISNAVTSGWFSYYVFRIPSAKRADFDTLRALTVIPSYLLGPFAFSTFASIVYCIASSRSHGFWRTDTALLLLAALACAVAGAFSIGNDGGYKNVMLPFAALIVCLLPIAVHGLSETHSDWRILGLVTIALQFLAFTFNPLSEKMLIASPHQRRGAEEFMGRLRSLPGEVYIPYHGFVTTQAGKPSHAHILATIDVLRMNDSVALRLRAEYDAAYAGHRFGAIIMEESPAFRLDSISGYTQRGTMVREPMTNLTRVADDVTRPQYLFLPVVTLEK